MRWMYDRGLVQARGGNASIADRERGVVYISPSGVPRRLLEPGMVAEVSLETGEVLRGRPSSEWRMHLAIYRARPEAVAVVHAHPRSLLALTHLGLELDPGLLSEAGIHVRGLARVPYITPGTRELAEAVGRAAGGGANAIVLERHGAVVWSSETLFHALDLLEALEDLAWISLQLSLHHECRG